MERRLVATSPPQSPHAEASEDAVLDREDWDDVESDRLLAHRTSLNRSGMRLLRKPQQAVALKILSTARRHNFSRLVFQLCSTWILCALVWIRWPIYHRKIFPLLETRFGDKMEVEPIIVSFAIVLPFLFAGTFFYWKKETVGSVVQESHKLKLVQWLKASPGIGKTVGFDTVDVIVVSGFLLLQLNLVIGSLLIDNESGNLAKAGYINRTARAFGMNGLYSMVLSVLLVSRLSFLHKFFALSGERAARYHVFVGQFGFFLLLQHGGMYLINWYMEGKVQILLLPCLSETCTPKQRYKSIRNFCGAVALTSLLIVAVSSMQWVRRLVYRRFIILHCLNAVFVVATVLHYYAASYWMVPAIVLYAIYRTVSAFGRGEASVVSATVMSNKVFQVELRRSSTSGSADFLPGQYVYIKVNSIGPEWHPFTISSSPLRNHHSFTLDIKVQGQFTTELLALIKTQRLSNVQVDGYYGSDIKLAPHMVFLAGGSGMTPFLSVLDHLKALADDNEAPTDNRELPRTLWLVWTCRDVEFLETHAVLLDTVNRCSRWKCNIWLHLTHTGGKTECEEDDETLTEPDVMSEESSPHMQRFYPTSLKRRAFSGHNDMIGLPVFTGTALGCVLVMFSVFQWQEYSAKSFARRFMLLGGGTLGAVLGASLVLMLLRRRNACKSSETNDDVIDIAMEEMETVGLDIASPAPPSTPRSLPTPAHSLLHRSFLIQNERPDLRSRLRDVHCQIREKYGTKASVMLLVSGPAGLQSDALLQARELSEPAFEVHRKSFLL